MLKTSTDQRGLLANMNVIAQAPGGVARLRELILTLAVQGKLVPQDPSDEPASELLKKIRAEKDRLIAEGKIKKDKPLPAITEEEKPFELPVGWEWVINGNLFSLRKGKNPKDLSEKPIGKPYLDIEALDRGQVRRFSCDLKAPTCNSNDILVVCDGSRSGLILQGKDGIIGSTLAAIDAPKELQPFIKLLFKSGYRRYNSGMKGAAIPHLDTKFLLNELNGLPPLSEQSRIVARVEELMRLCDALEEKGRLEQTQHQQLLQAMLDSLTQTTDAQELARHWQRLAQHFDLLIDRPEAVDALEQTILQLAVRGLLVPQDPSDEPASELLKKIRVEKDRLIAEGKIKQDKALSPITDEEKEFDLRAGWERVRLRDLVSHLGDGLHGTPNYSTIGEYYFVNGNNLRDGVIVIKSETKRVDKSEFEKYKKPLDETTVLVSINGTLGNVAFYNGEKVVLGKSACYFNLTSGIKKSFVRIILESPDFKKYAYKSATGSTIKNLGLKAIGDWPIALPPLAEQSRIVARVTELRALCQQLREKLTQARTTQTQLAQAWVEQVATI